MRKAEVALARKLVSDGVVFVPALSGLGAASHVGRGDIAEYMELDKAFHLDLLSLAGNSRLVGAVARLRDETRLYGLRRVAGTRAFVATIKEHLALLSALEAGDADEVERILRSHIGHARGMLAGP